MKINKEFKKIISSIDKLINFKPNIKNVSLYGLEFDILWSHFKKFERQNMAELLSNSILYKNVEITRIENE